MPKQITLSSTAEEYLEKLAEDVASGEVQTHQLPPCLRQWWWLAYFTGYDSRQPEIDRINFDRDRLWMAAFNPGHKLDPNRPTYAELERRRGNHEHAAQIEADLEVLFGQVNA